MFKQVFNLEGVDVRRSHGGKDYIFAPGGYRERTAMPCRAGFLRARWVNVSPTSLGKSRAEEFDREFDPDTS